LDKEQRSGTHHRTISHHSIRLNFGVLIEQLLCAWHVSGWAGKRARSECRPGWWSSGRRFRAEGASSNDRNAAQ